VGGLQKDAVRAYLCKFYGSCLAKAARFDDKTLPCRGCRLRCDIPPWELYDARQCWILVAAVLRPEIFMRYIQWGRRQSSDAVDEKRTGT